MKKNGITIVLLFASIDLSKYRNSPSTEIVADIWNHSIEMRESIERKAFSASI